MPSDSKKRRDAKKKEAAKSKQKKPLTKEEETNGVDQRDSDEEDSINGKIPDGEEAALVKKLQEDMDLNAQARACTGVLAVHPRSRDTKIENFSITFHGVELLADTKLELNCGRKYGLVGQNGSGRYILHYTFYKWVKFKVPFR